jgi:hypothetical protein
VQILPPLLTRQDKRITMKNKEHYLYKTWQSMRQRCSNPNVKSFKNWGGRGITVCPEWDDFWVFVADMGDRPEGHTLDRIDNDKGYSPDNCRWASRHQQSINSRKVKDAKGYYFNKNAGKYQAHINIDGKPVYLGCFDTPEEARHRYLIAKHNKMNKASVL